MVGNPVFLYTKGSERHKVNYGFCGLVWLDWALNSRDPPASVSPLVGFKVCIITFHHNSK